MTLALSPSTSADRRSLANFSANLAALAITQPALAAGAVPPRDELEWVFGRDGSLTARDADGQWWAGCSLPSRAAGAMLEKMDVHAPVTCFLDPPHAAHVRTALDKLTAGQAVVAVLPEEAGLRVLLACENFSADVNAHRLRLVAGPSWADDLFDVLDRQIGLAVPSQFLRLGTSDERLIERLITDAQAVFSRLTTQRSERMQSIIETYPEPAADRRKLCVMRPSQFRLWNDEGYVLGNIAAALDAVALDTDDPASASPLQLAKTASECGVFLAPNFARADMPGVLPIALPWLTWVTNGRVPRFNVAASGDQLLVTDIPTQAAAVAAGWPAARVHLAAWPEAIPPASSAARCLTVLADTIPVETPDDLEDFSSHRVLWECIAGELAKNPFAIDGDVGVYLIAQMRRFDVSADSFPTDRFIHSLIVPAYQQSLVRILLENGLPVCLYGSGWEEIEAFGQYAAGTLASRGDFDRALVTATVLVHVWPSTASHPLDAMGRPVVRRNGRRTDAFANQARQVLKLNAPSVSSSVPPLTALRVVELLRK